jgi:membrane associated rhomboid family serine protease
MFMHGGFMHLAGNMLYLWIFGNNIEDVLGKIGYLLFYLAGGLVAALSHILANPLSDVPMVGASGAISAVLGAYIVLFPRAHVIILLWVVFVVRFIPVPAFLVLGVWFVMQLSGVLGDSGTGGGIAWFAHIGGFLAGVVMILVSGARAKRNPRWM